MRLLFFVGVSALAGLSVAMPTLWFFSLVALALFFYGLLFLSRQAGEALLSGFLFGFATVGAGIWWVWDALPLLWIDIDSLVVQWSVVGISWVFVALTLALSSAIYAWCVWKIREHPLLPLFIVLGWVLQEAGRQWIFYVATLGEQALYGAHFSISALGYTLAENAYLLQLAQTGGIYGLSFTAALIAISGVLLFQTLRHKKKYLRTGVVVSVMLVVLSVPLWRTYTYPNDHTMHVAIISTSIPITENERVAPLYISLLEELAGSETVPDVIIFPEGNGLVEMYPDATRREESLKELFGTKEVLIISSDYTTGNDEKKRSVLYYDSTTRGTIAIHEKMFLMAQGEYAPYVSAPLFKMLNNKTVNDHMQGLGMSLINGTRPTAVPYNGAVFGGLLCSEVLSPQLYRDLVRKYDANVLVNLSHTSWFNESETLFRKMQQMAKVHAVQHRLYFLQAANGSPSFVLNPEGAIVNTTAMGETGVLRVAIPVRSE